MHRQSVLVKPECSVCVAQLEEMRKLREERDMMLENLTAVQRRCTELLEEVRGLKERIAELRHGFDLQ